jgi:glycosyltransferase involved in cell wall biosynthesis
MKVLFVSSGKSGGTGPVVMNQGESLKKAGIEIHYHLIEPGITGYIRAVGRIRRAAREGKYDIVHAHYVWSALSATLARVRPIVVSLMGSDVFVPPVARFIIRLFARWQWDAVIVKTREMKELLNLESAIIIPNGVDTDRFFPVDRVTARNHLGLSLYKRLVVFIAGINRSEKRIGLARKAVEALDDPNVEFMHVFDRPNSEIPWFLNAADLLLLTSEREGSVNVVKEAMACNCPVVSTDVGDVRQIISETDGCYLAGSDEERIAEGIRKALVFNRKTDGRKRIFALGLDAGSVAESITGLYEKTVQSFLTR